MKDRCINDLLIRILWFTVSEDNCGLEWLVWVERVEWIVQWLHWIHFEFLTVYRIETVENTRQFVFHSEPDTGHQRVLSKHINRMIVDIEDISEW